MPFWVAVQMVKALMGVILFALLFALIIWTLLDDWNLKRGEKQTMLIEILQDLYDARYKQDRKKMERCFIALKHYGMDMDTAIDILNAGEKYFGRKYHFEEDVS